MVNSLVSPFGASIILFYHRARRIFVIWAREYINRVYKLDMSFDEVSLIAEAIEHGFRNELHREPTIREWVNFTIGFRSSKDFNTLRRYMECFLRFSNKEERPARASLIVSPYYRLYHESGRDEQKALQRFSEMCANVFAVLHRGQIPERDASLDWTSEDVIRDYVARLTARKKSLLRTWWERFLTH